MPVLTDQELNESALIDILRDPGYVDFFRNGPRTFTYSAPLANSDAGCTQTFLARKFVHHDWIDGQDVVQAGQTADNDGFNFLFHNLEADLDQAKADITTLFACVARLRQQLATGLAEIKAELNRIDSDVWTLTPNKGLVAKIPPTKFVGVTKIGTEQMAVLQNADGSFQTMSLKLDPAIAIHPAGTVDRIGNTASFGAFTASNADLAGLFASNHTPTTAEVIAKVGNVTLDNGKTVSDVLSGLQTTTTYKSPTELSDAVATYEAAVVKSSADATATKTSLGVDPANGSTATAALTNVGTIDAVTKGKLDAAGIKTVGDLAAADPAKLESITGSKAGAASLRATGVMLKGIG